MGEPEDKIEMHVAFLKEIVQKLYFLQKIFFKSDVGSVSHKEASCLLLIIFCCCCFYEKNQSRKITDAASLIEVN